MQRTSFFLSLLHFCTSYVFTASSTRAHDEASEMERKETAAIKLQAGFRGMKGRQELQKRRKTITPFPTPDS